MIPPLTAMMKSKCTILPVITILRISSAYLSVNLSYQQPEFWSSIVRSNARKKLCDWYYHIHATLSCYSREQVRQSVEMEWRKYRIKKGNITTDSIRNCIPAFETNVQVHWQTLSRYGYVQVHPRTLPKYGNLVADQVGFDHHNYIEENEYLDVQLYMHNLKRHLWIPYAHCTPFPAWAAQSVND